jgi:adenylosuccinate synthase
MLVKPANLLAERDELVANGEENILERLTIDPEAYLVTPYHALLRRMEERARGNKRQGSCGLGVGLAARDREVLGGKGLRVLDLLHPVTLAEKLNAHWRDIYAAASHLTKEVGGDGVDELLSEALQRIPVSRVLDDLLYCGEQLQPCFLSDRVVLTQSAQGGPVLLEGAQGMLLDRAFGFWPYVTKTDASVRSIGPFVERSGVIQSVQRIGILRAYSTRHGPGPLVTEDYGVPRNHHERHNCCDEWQGSFRVGCFDLLLARYAVQTAGGLDALAITHLDALRHGEVMVCTAYEYVGPGSKDLGDYFEFSTRSGAPTIIGIRAPKQPTVQGQTRLAELLLQCRPVEFKQFKQWGDVGHVDSLHELPDSIREFLDFLSEGDGLGLPVALVSYGATADESAFNSDLF